jgi:hypothetical protein
MYKSLFLSYQSYTVFMNSNLVARSRDEASGGILMCAFVDVSPWLIEGCKSWSLPIASSLTHKSMSKLLEQGESRLLCSRKYYIYIYIHTLYITYGDEPMSHHLNQSTGHQSSQPHGSSRAPTRATESRVLPASNSIPHGTESCERSRPSRSALLAPIEPTRLDRVIDPARASNLRDSAILWFLLQLTQSFYDLVSNFLYIEVIFGIVLNHFLLLQCSTILWFCYTELSHFTTLLIYFVILLQLPQSFCDLVSNFWYIELSYFCNSAQPFFDCYSTKLFCDFVILNSAILLQCSAILWFCYNYLSRFVMLSPIFYILNSTFFATVLIHFSIATVLNRSIFLL